MEDYLNYTQAELDDEFFAVCWAGGNLERVRYLLTSPELTLHANINTRKSSGLDWACINGDLDIVKYLLTSPELVEHPDLKIYGRNALYWACEKGQLQVVQYLLTSPQLLADGLPFCNLPNIKKDSFMTACSNGRLEVVQYLLTSPELNQAKYTLRDMHSEGLSKASENGQLEIIKYLLTSPKLKDFGFASLNENSYIPFVSAFTNSQIAVIEYLVLELGIPFTQDIKEFLNSNPNSDLDSSVILKMFDSRDLKDKLESKLESKITVAKKSKL